MRRTSTSTPTLAGAVWLRRNGSIAALAAMIASSTPSVAGAPQNPDFHGLLSIVKTLLSVRHHGIDYVARHIGVQFDLLRNFGIPMYGARLKSGGPAGSIEARIWPDRSQKGGMFVVYPRKELACIGVDDVIDTMGSDVMATPPRPGPPVDADTPPVKGPVNLPTYYSYKTSWGDLSFGFLAHGKDDCLSSIIMSWDD